ncbi:MAG: penicillin-binding protein activator LpoB, partial [Candidatus Omnitrophica bacterium]|nr:penicillin-binding protein activator LpoB [Candidatus Omnitrophota bacterium]
FAKNKREPVVIVDAVSNKSHEHISSQVFTKDLERSLINSGEIKFVASRDERKEVRTERDDQQTGLTAKETVKRKGFETGADFMLQGTINSVKDEIKGRYVILYQVNLELIDLTSNEKVWLGQKEIKKFVKKGKLSL